MEIKNIVNQEDKNNSYTVVDKTEAFMRKSRKHYFTIILVGIFLLIFLGSLVFEFYHIVNKATPSLSLKENIEVVEQNETSHLQKITQLFSWFQKKEDTNSAQNSEVESENVEQEPLKNEILAVDTQEQDLIEDIQNQNIEQVANDTRAENLVDIKNFKTIPSNKNDHNYSLQLLAVKEKRFADLKDIAQILIDENYYTYIYKTPYKIKSQSSNEKDYYFRLRIGFFKTKSDAVKTAHELIKQYPRIFKNYFVALPLKEEYQSDFFLFSPENQE